MNTIKITAAVIILAAANIATADDPHSVPVISSGASQGRTIVNINSQAISLAASQINPQVNSKAWQMGVGIGNHNNTTAIALGLAKRVNKNLLFSGTVGIENDNIGTGIGFNFKF